MRMAVFALSSLLLLSAFPAIARADCQARVDAMEPRLETVTDQNQRAQLDNDVRHARKELAEGDEGDCNKWMDRAAKLLDQH